MALNVGSSANHGVIVRYASQHQQTWPSRVVVPRRLRSKRVVGGSTTSLLRVENLEREVAEFWRIITPNTSALSVFAGLVVFMERFNAMVNYLLNSRVWT